MGMLRAVSLRHLLRHPAQLALALIGLTLGVGTIVAVDIATASAQRAFELSLQAVNGAATHQVSAGPGGIDEALYVRLRGASGAAGALDLAPLVTGYATVQGRALELIGTDPFAAAALNAGSGAMRGNSAPSDSSYSFFASCRTCVARDASAGPAKNGLSG